MFYSEILGKMDIQKIGYGISLMNEEQIIEELWKIREKLNINNVYDMYMIVIIFSMFSCKHPNAYLLTNFLKLECEERMKYAI